jgi:hypothetical protein
LRWLVWAPVAWLGAAFFLLVYPLYAWEMKRNGYAFRNAQLRD